jgi:hypothetical protein
VQISGSGERYRKLQAEGFSVELLIFFSEIKLGL